MSPTPQATRPFSYTACTDALYTLALFRQDRAKHAGRKILVDKPGKSGDEISFAYSAIMYEQYVILYCIIGPICQGPNGHVRASLEI